MALISKYFSVYFFKNKYILLYNDSIAINFKKFIIDKYTDLPSVFQFFSVDSVMSNGDLFWNYILHLVILSLL